MYTKKEREYYNIQRDRNCKELSITKNEYNWLRRKGEALRQEYENECNDTDYVETRKRATILETEIKIKCTMLDINLYLQGDCRGASVYVSKETIPENNYTQAICIY